MMTDLVMLAMPLPADQHPMFVYLSGLGPGSRRTMRSALDTIAALLTEGRVGADRVAWHLLGYQHVRAVRAALAERYAPASVNKALAALRGVLREAWRLGLMSAEQYQRASDVGGIKPDPRPQGRVLTAADLRALFAACDSETTSGAQDVAILTLCYGGGLKRQEAVAVDISDLDLGAQCLHIRRSVGTKDRDAFLPPWAIENLAAWLAFRGDEPGPLLLRVLKGGAIQPGRMSSHAVYTTLRRIAKHAGVGKVTPTDLRTTNIDGLIAGGVDISIVSRLAGHASVVTTQRYDRRGDPEKRAAIDAVKLPR